MAHMLIRICRSNTLWSTYNQSRTRAGIRCIRCNLFCKQRQSPPWSCPSFVELLPVDPQMTLLDLALELTDTDQGLRGFFEYNIDLFDPATIGNMLADYQTLLAQIADNPAQPLVDLLHRRSRSVGA